MAAVKGEGEASVLNLVDKQTPEICMVAVRQDGEALEYVRERTPEICIEAVKQNARALQFVHELDAIPLALRLEVAGSRHEAFNYSPFDTAPYSPLDTLAKDENEAVRVRVAENPHTCHNTLYALARDKRECEAVRMAVAGNPSTPPELLTELKDGLEGMSKIPTKVGNVDITPKQRKALQDGKSVTLSGLIDKAGNVHKTMHVAFDREAGKVKLTQEKNQSPKAKVKAAPARSRQSKFRL